MLRFGGRHSFQQVIQVDPGFEIIRLGGFHQSVQGGTGIGSLRTTREENILSADHKGSDGVFDFDVIDGYIVVFEIGTRKSSDLACFHGG